MNHGATRVTRVRMRIGVAFLPRMCVEQEIAEGRLLAVRVPEFQVERKIYLVRPSRRALSYAAEAFLNALNQPAPQPLRRIPPKSASAPDNSAAHLPANHPHTRLHGAICAANQAVYRHSRKSPDLHGMGTTLVSVLLEAATADSVAPALWVAHVGDSRCYRLRRGELQLLTQDHSLVEEHIRAGILTRVQANRSPIRNIITRAIGSQLTVEPEIAAHDPQSGDLYLLASDGLTRELADPEIAKILTIALARATNTTALESACEALIDAANRKGGRDNITVLLITCP